MIIYKATNIINNMSYIGQTVQTLQSRIRDHMKRGNYFHNALRKHGKENFTWDILAECNDVDTLNKLEIYYIGYYDTYNNGYNLTLGGEGTVGNNSQSLGERNPNYGGVITRRPEIREKIRNTIIANGSSRGKNNGMYGRHRYGEEAAHKHPVKIQGKFYPTKRLATKDTGISLYILNKRIEAGIEGYEAVKPGK